jgi:hypothetical protein
LTNSNPSFGQGVRGYAHYFRTAYADYVIGDYMTEAVFPTILHQDPRYFRRGTGSGWPRPGYAGGQPGVDMVSNILKEFWPDLERKFSRKHTFLKP